ncbi:hypothetical protein FQZ97_635640 [compost metagenome]
MARTNFVFFCEFKKICSIKFFDKLKVLFLLLTHATFRQINVGTPKPKKNSIY